MLLWASLLLLAPISGQFAIVPKPVISLHPSWTTVFQGETVKLTCNGFHFSVPEKTKWYWGYYGKEREIPGNTLEVRESGEYRCQAQGSPLSDPVRLTFSTAPLILQAPHSVFEGDTLVLRCQKSGKEKLTAVKYTWNGKVLLNSNKSLDLSIPRASLNNSGNYGCIGSWDKHYVFKSHSKVIKIQELFPPPKLKATASTPTEGSSVNLSCETHLPPERLDTPLYFIFFKDNRVILSGWNKSSQLHIPTIWRENSGLYQCSAETVTHSVRKHSLSLPIRVQSIPVSQVSMETQPPGDQAVEGETLVFVCSVAEGTGVTTFSWHREATKESLGSKTERSQRAELEIQIIRQSHAAGYYCIADNGHGPVRSPVVNISVRETPGNRNGLIAAGAAGGLLSILLLGVTMLFLHWHQRKSGDCFRREETRSPPTPRPGKSSHSIHPAQVKLQLLSGNDEDSPLRSCSWPQLGKVHPKEGDLVYAEIQTIHLGEEGEANTFRTPLEDKHASVVYSEVKAQLPDSSVGKVSSKDKDDMECYENVLLK